MSAWSVLVFSSNEDEYERNLRSLSSKICDSVMVDSL